MAAARSARTPAAQPSFARNIPPDEDRAFVYSEGFTTPRSLYLATAAGNLQKPAELPARFDASQQVVEQYEATSKDGTKVPYFVVRQKDLKLDGTEPDAALRLWRLPGLA